MDGNRVKHAAEAESSASQGAGLLELWCGAGQVVWHHAGMCRLSAASGQLGAEFPATLARMVLERRRQKRAEAARIGREHLFESRLQWILAWWSVCERTGRGSCLRFAFVMHPLY